jgi:Na+-transporting methylmalonyl-CoA/oxaloacetate decarboxylase gamma subunit
VGQRVRDLGGRLGRRLPGGRLPGLRTVKLVLAAVLSYVLAGALDTSPDRVLAPLTALLVVQLTLFQTLSSAIGRVVSVLTGVVLAVAVSDLLGVSWWSFGLLVLLSLAAGQALRLRSHLLEVPISAMIVLALGGTASSATGRVVETLLGGATGLAVNLLVAPPLHVRPAEEAVGRLAERLAAFLDELAAELRQGWSRAAAGAWLDRARALGRDVERADRDLSRAEESVRLHPRGSRARAARPRLRAGLAGFEHAYVVVRNLCRALLDRAHFVPEDRQDHAFPEPVRAALADVLTTLAAATRAAGAFTAATRPADASADEVTACLAAVLEQRDRLAVLLEVSPVHDRGAWQQHGALLAAVDRLRVELEAAVRPGADGWRPAPLTERPRAAVRRVVAAPRRRR